ncbi:MAG: hypothetical protein KIT69_07020 [Propionibacteriaceae bacterium]|nr:hypothetical protein [Propionibacteriaceae bacterium]
MSEIQVAINNNFIFDLINKYMKLFDNKIYEILHKIILAKNNIVNEPTLLTYIFEKYIYIDDIYDNSENEDKYQECFYKLFDLFLLSSPTLKLSHNLLKKLCDINNNSKRNIKLKYIKKIILVNVGYLYSIFEIKMLISYINKLPDITEKKLKVYKKILLGAISINDIHRLFSGHKIYLFEDIVPVDIYNILYQFVYDNYNINHNYISNVDIKINYSFNEIKDLIHDMTQDTFDFVKNIINNIENFDEMKDNNNNITLLFYIIMYSYNKITSLDHRNLFIQLFDICIKKVKNINICSSSENNTCLHTLMKFITYCPGDNTDIYYNLCGVRLPNIFSQNDNFSLIDKLITAGIDVNIRNKENQTPLLRMIEINTENKASFDIILPYIKYLIDKDTYINEYDNQIILKQLGITNSNIIIDYYNEHIKNKLNTLNNITVNNSLPSDKNNKIYVKTKDNIFIYNEEITIYYE